MAISSATSAPAYIPPVNTQRVSTGRDVDGDNDGSKKVGEVENKAASIQSGAASSTVGTRINVTA